MKIAIVAPSPVPFVTGGAENIYAGLFHAINQSGQHQAELIKLPTREQSFWALIDSYYAFASLDLRHFDAIISLKYPAWMVAHPRHIVYMQHKLRGFYDTWNRDGRQAGLLDPRLLAHPPVRAVWDYMQRADAVPRTEALLHLRWLLERLRATADLPEDGCAFPGALIRRVVHCLDSIALRPDHIFAYHAISQTVADRPGYFPLGVPVRVLHHPSSLPLTPQSERGGKHVFTASRLDSAKRMGLLIDGFMLSQTKQPFLIAGTGVEQSALQRRAAADPRIRFLGFVDSAQLAQLYAEAAMVLFAPQDEDFGLVAWEAMASGCPLITTHDAGGCTELITHEVDGVVVAPSPAAIAVAIDRLDQAPDFAKQLGAAAQRRAARITWPGLVDELLGGLSHPAAPAVLKGRRPRITVLSTYPVTGAKGGGPARLFHLHHRLRQFADIDLLVFDSRAKTAIRRTLAEGLTETVIAAEPAYRSAEHALSAAAGWPPISDSAFPIIHHHAPAFCAATLRACAQSQMVILEHPFLLPALPKTCTNLVYNAHNVEGALKHEIYPPSQAGRLLLDSVTAIEREACARASEIWCCTDDDRRLLMATYRLTQARFVSVPNGVDTKMIPFVSPAERARRRREYGFGADTKPTAYFIGSWHGPNIEAANRIIQCAWYLYDIRFVIAGDVCDALGAHLPENVVLTGRLDDAASLAMLTTCDIALNPMRGGSGSNLKIFEYCAAGAPVVSTAVGARGSALQPGAHMHEAAFDTFEEGIIAVWAETPDQRALRSRAARRHVAQYFDWDVIVAGLLRDSRSLAALQMSSACRMGE